MVRVETLIRSPIFPHTKAPQRRRVGRTELAGGEDEAWCRVIQRRRRSDGLNVVVFVSGREEDDDDDDDEWKERNEISCE